MLRLAVRGLAAALVLAGSAATAAAAEQKTYAPVELTQTSALNAIEALPAIAEVARRHQGQGARGSADNPVAGLANAALYQLAVADLDGAVTPYGFEGYWDWVNHVTSLFQAYAFVQSQGAMAAAAPAMAEAIKRIMADPNIPQAQKDALAAQAKAMGTANAALTTGGPSDNNQNIARLLGERIMAATKAMGQSR
jgi:hypothetical protein